jgi:uncharacterized protein
MMVEMYVSCLTLDPATNMPFIVLKDSDGKYSLPIWIGIFEASAIALELEGIKPQRPMTHDLLSGLLVGLGAKVEKVEIKDLKENTFYASIHVRKSDGTLITMDSRPSDCIALALRVKAPIYVMDEIIMRSRRIEIGKPKGEDSLDKDRWSEILENMSPSSFGKYKM